MAPPASKKDSRVVLSVRDYQGYPDTSPYDPPNGVYSQVEEVLSGLGLDPENLRSRNRWNPLGDLVRPGGLVVLKPNFVANKDQERALVGDRLLCSSTHASVLRPLLDYASRAVGPEGRITIVDSPVEGTDLGAVIGPLGVPQLLEWAKDTLPTRVELLDLRDFRLVPRMLLDNRPLGRRSLNLGLLQRIPLAGDPRGYVTVDLGKESAFGDLPKGRLARLRFHRGHPHGPRPHHTETVHQYSLSRTVLASDLFINVPKLKTHKKAGVTLAMKSLIGTTNRKYWLPHYTAGAPPVGDEYPEEPGWFDRLQARLSRIPLPGGHAAILSCPPRGGHKIFMDGGNSANDTIWRVVVDFNRILLYSDGGGRMQETPQRAYLALIDGILAGEGEGPINADPRPAGLLAGSLDPLAADAASARAMGFDPGSIPSVQGALGDHRWPFALGSLDDLEIYPEEAAEVNLRMRPPRTWEHLIIGG